MQIIQLYTSCARSGWRFYVGKYVCINIQACSCVLHYTTATLLSDVLVNGCFQLPCSNKTETKSTAAAATTWQGRKRSIVFSLLVRLYSSASSSPPLSLSYTECLHTEVPSDAAKTQRTHRKRNTNTSRKNAELKKLATCAYAYECIVTRMQTHAGANAKHLLVWMNVHTCRALAERELHYRSLKYFCGRYALFR